jgi:hypothetical protein
LKFQPFTSIILMVTIQYTAFKRRLIDFLYLSTLEQQNCYLTQIKVNEMLCFVGDVTTKVTPDDHMPSRDKAERKIRKDRAQPLKEKIQSQTLTMLVRVSCRTLF